MIYVIIAAVVLLLLPVFLCAPRIPSEKKKAPFRNRNCAHRGLYTEDQSVPENSIPAFERAVENGYGIELDVQLSTDGQVFVFHDDDLERATGKTGRADGCSYGELGKLQLFGTDQKIPLFTDVLKTVDGKVPLIVELKNGKNNKELCRKTYEILKEYRGIYCVESFHPFIVAWFRFHAPHIFRGQLSQQPDVYVRGGMNEAYGFVLGNTLLNFAARPNFIAYKTGPKPFFIRLADFLGAFKVCWTSRDPSNEKLYDCVIFEHYRPETTYRGER